MFFPRSKTEIGQDKKYYSTKTRFSLSAALSFKLTSLYLKGLRLRKTLNVARLFS